MAESTGFDFSSLSVEAEPMKMREGVGRKPRFETNPFLPFVLESWNAGKGDPEKGGRSVTVPKAQVKDVTYLLRQAAKSIDGEDLGVAIAVTLPDKDSVKRLTPEELESMNDRKHVKVRFCAKKRRAYTKSEQQEDAAQSSTSENAASS